VRNQFQQDLSQLIHNQINLRVYNAIGRKEKVLARRKAGLGVGAWMAFILLVAVFVVVLNVPLVLASGTIYIRADGSIDPSTAPISTVDSVTYTFTDNINDSLVVERDNIVVNGAGHVLEGAGTGNGMSLTGRSNADGIPLLPSSI
jgi:hypothetical protein